MLPHMAEVRWSGKQKTHLYRLLPVGEAQVAIDDAIHVAEGEAVAVLGRDAKVAGVVGPGANAVGSLPFLGALGGPGAFGRLPVALLWACTAPVERSGEWPLPPIADPGSGHKCAGASARGTYGLAVADVAKLAAALHTEARPLGNDAGDRSAHQTLATAAATFWTQSREPVATRQAAMEEALPRLAATVLDGQGLTVSGLKLVLRLPVGFTPTPGSPLR